MNLRVVAPHSMPSMIGLLKKGKMECALRQKDGPARVRSPRLVQSGLQYLCGLGGNRSGSVVKRGALRAMMNPWVSGNFPRPESCTLYGAAATY